MKEVENPLGSASVKPFFLQHKNTEGSPVDRRGVTVCLQCGAAIAMQSQVSDVGRVQATALP